MPTRKRLNTILDPLKLSHRGLVHGNIVDVRADAWGNETVLLNGAAASKQSALLSTPSHLFVIVDEHGQTRNVEIRGLVRFGGLLGVRGYLVLVDGLERGILNPSTLGEPTDRCLYCGYELRNLPVVNGEVQCPECGRHRDATLLVLTGKSRSASAPPNNPVE